MEDFERFQRKNAALARAYEVDATKKKVETNLGAEKSAIRQDKSCFNCKKKSRCDTFRGWRTGGGSGVVSFGGESNKSWLCESYEPMAERKKEQSLSPQQVKNLYKNALKGRI
jgi:hypothetical protein